jgi:hypothetical protein
MHALLGREVQSKIDGEIDLGEAIALGTSSNASWIVFRDDGPAGAALELS